MKRCDGIPYGSHPQQVLNVYIPEAEHFPVFVYFHGGGLEGGTHDEPFIPDMVEKGIAVVSGAYRMYPDARFPQFIEDGASVVAWAKKHMSEYGKVTGFYVGGSSAGGYITQMLCFDERYLAKQGLSNADIDGYFHDAGQPTAHYNVLRERGIDPKRIIVDETAPLFFVEGGRNYPYMEIVVSDDDMGSRYEQTLLLAAALEQFGHKNVFLNIRENSTHCRYLGLKNEEGGWLFADMVYEFIANAPQK